MKLTYYIVPKLHEDQPYVVLSHIISKDIDNQTSDQLNTGKSAEDIINIVSTLVNALSVLE